MTTTTFRHAPIPFRDEHGVNCLRVPLDRAGRSYAIVTEADYRRVRRAGATGAWLLNDAAPGRTYVRTSVRTGRGESTLVMVARLIMSAPPRTVVRYVNGNRLDLRPWNLAVQKGKAKRDDMQLVERGRRASQEAFRQEARA